MRWAIPIFVVCSQILACVDVATFEPPPVPEQARAAIYIIERSGGERIVRAAQVIDGRAALASLPADTLRTSILSYRCTLDEMQLDPGVQALRDSTTGLLPLPEPLAATSMNILDGETPVWTPLQGAPLVASRRLPLDLAYLECPEFVLHPVILEETDLVSGFFAVKLSDDRWLAGTENGRYFYIDPTERRSSIPPNKSDSPDSIGAMRGDQTWIYTKTGELLVGDATQCLPGEACFVQVASGGPTGRRAWLVDDAEGEDVFVIVQDELADRTHFIRSDSNGFVELLSWEMGNAVLGFATYVGGLVRNGQTILALDAPGGQVYRHDGTQTVPERLPLDAMAPNSLRDVEGYGPLVGTEFGRILVSRNNYEELPKGDNQFLIFDMVGVDDGLLIVGQGAMDQYHPDLGGCGYALGEFAGTAYSATTLNDDILVMSQAPFQPPLTGTILERQNPIPSCLSR